MSYSINEAIREANVVTESLLELRNAYPDAKNIAGRWLSEMVTLEDCDDFEIAPRCNDVILRARKRMSTGAFVYPGIGILDATTVGMLATRALKESTVWADISSIVDGANGIGECRERLREKPEAMKLFLDIAFERNRDQ